MESNIYNFFAKIFSCLAIWLDESAFGKLFNKISAALAKFFVHSAVGGLFSKTPSAEKLFSSSVFLKIITAPVRLLKRVARSLPDKWEKIYGKSALVTIADNFELISSKIYGSVFLTFGITHFVLSLVLKGFSPSLAAADLVIVLFSVLLILLDRSLKSLFKGSSLLLAFGGLFCEVNKRSSKLFLSEKELELNVGFTAVFIGVFSGIFACVLPLKAFVLLFGGVIFAMLTVKYIELGVFVTVIGSPFLPTMVLAALCMLCLFSLAVKIAVHKDFKLRVNYLDIFVIFFMTAAFYGCINSFDFLSSVKIFFIYFAFIMFYFVITNTVTSYAKWKAVVSGVALSAALVALYGVVQNFTGVSSTASWVDGEMFNNIKVRVYSTFENPNVLGEFLVIMIPTAAALVWGSKKLGHKMVYTCIMLIMCACMVFTWSRGAWLGVFAAVVIFFFVMDKRWTLAAIAGIFFIPMFLGSNSAIANRLLSIGNTQDTSTAYRVSIWMASVKLIKNFWMSGIGMGSAPFTMIYPKFALAGANFALHSHNLFLQLCVEMGVIGIVSFVLLIIAYVRQAYSVIVYKSRKKLMPTVVLAMASGVLGYMLQGLTDNVWYNYRMMFVFWAIVAITSAGYNIVKSGEELPE